MREIPHCRQVPGERRRRWFTSIDLDLIVWYEADQTAFGFQLCFRVPVERERAVTWTRDGGYRHEVVDDGESSGRRKGSPVMARDRGHRT